MRGKDEYQHAADPEADESGTGHACGGFDPQCDRWRLRVQQRLGEGPIYTCHVYRVRVAPNMGPKRFGAGEARSAATGARTDRPVRTTTAGGNRMRPVPNGGKPAHHFPDTVHTPRPPPRPGTDGQHRETRRPEEAPTGEGIAEAKVPPPICGPHTYPGKPGNGRKTCFASRSSSSGNTWWRNSHQAFTRESGAPPRPPARQGAPGPPRETSPPPPGDGPTRQLGAPQRTSARRADTSTPRPEVRKRWSGTDRPQRASPSRPSTSVYLSSLATGIRSLACDRCTDFSKIHSSTGAHFGIGSSRATGVSSAPWASTPPPTKAFRPSVRLHTPHDP